MAGETVEVFWSDWDPIFNHTSQGELAIINPLNQVIDYVQWGSADHSAELNAVTNNIWTVNDFIAGEPPYVYTGTGGFGVAEWSFVPYVCNVISANAGVTSACDLTSNMYTQEISLILLNPPASGTINLNGQDFILEDETLVVLLEGSLRLTLH